MSVSVYARNFNNNSLVYAHAGEPTFCENVHRLGTFTTDVMSGDLPKPGDFELEPGMEIGATKCPVCGGAVISGVGIYFFEDFK